MIKKISKANGNHTMAANVVSHATEIIQLKYNLAYVSGLCNELKQLDDMKEQNSTKKMINYL